MGVPRDELATLLWPDRPAGRARGSLRQALWSIRKALGEDIFTSQDPVQLTPGRVSTDIQEVESLIDEGRLLEALTLWSAAPFRFFPDPGSPPWRRWADEVRDGAERRFGRVLLDEGHRALGRAGPGEALKWFEAALRVEPHRRSVHEGRIRTLLLLNRNADAEAALAEAEREGGVESDQGIAGAGGSDPEWTELHELRRLIKVARPAPREPGPPSLAHKPGSPSLAREPDPSSPSREPGPSSPPRGPGPSSPPQEPAGGPSLPPTAEPAFPEEGSPATNGIREQGTRSGLEGIPFLRDGSVRDRLIARWTRAQSGTTQVVAVLGEPGVGKRQMVAEVERAARLQLATVVRVRGVRGGGDPPLTLLGQLVGQLIQCPGAAGTSIASEQVLRRMVPSRTNDPSVFAAAPWTHDPPEGSPGSRSRGPGDPDYLTSVAIADALVDLLGAVADENPLLLVVEECQRVDAESRDILTLALRELARHPIMAILTAAPSLPGSGMDRALGQLVGEGSERLVELARWGPAEVALLAETLGGRVSADDLLAVGEGHPGITMAVVKSRFEDAGEEVDGPLELPPHILDRWLGRWERLGVRAREILGQVVSSPKPVPLQAVLAWDLTPEGEREARASVDRLLAEGLLRLLPGLFLTPVHRELGALIRPRWEAEQAAMQGVEGRRRGPGQGDDPTLLRKVTAAAWVVASVVLALALFLPNQPAASGAAGSTEARAFGGGTLFFIGRDEIVQVTPDHRSPGEWATERIELLEGGHHRRSLPLRAENGEIHWIAGSTPGDEKPWISPSSRRPVSRICTAPRGTTFPKASPRTGAGSLFAPSRWISRTIRSTSCWSRWRESGTPMGGSPRGSGWTGQTPEGATPGGPRLKGPRGSGPGPTEPGPAGPGAVISSSLRAPA